MINKTSPPFQRNTLVDNVTAELRRMILEQEIMPGEFLPARKDLAARFGVGLSTIQEGIQALAAVGMLESRPGKGTWVREDTLDMLIHPTTVETRLGELDIQQLYDARLVVEVGLAELAAQNAKPEDIQKIQDALTALEDSQGDDEAFIAADLAFHIAVAQAGHNKLLEQFYHLSRKLLEEVIAELIKLPSVKENGIRIQGEIARAIQDADVEQARRATLDHMEIIKDLIKKL
ncbi:MAG: HTH-type transcriptional regulator LutR [Chloroflexi bacterium]|nr:HTH-type transcriptional regulator LutR [Chloroflexota bacterium]